MNKKELAEKYKALNPFEKLMGAILSSQFIDARLNSEQLRLIMEDIEQMLQQINHYRENFNTEAYQKPNDFLLSVEPEEEDFNWLPFLNGLGGMLRKYRHPMLIHACNLFTAFSICRSQIRGLQNVDGNEERLAAKDALLKVFQYRLQECKKALDEIIQGEIKFTFPGGKERSVTLADFDLCGFFGQPYGLDENKVE